MERESSLWAIVPLVRIILGFLDQYRLVRAKRVCRLWRSIVAELYNPEKEPAFRDIVWNRLWLSLKDKHITYQHCENVMVFGDENFVNVWLEQLPNIDLNMATKQAMAHCNIPIAIKLMNNSFVSDKTICYCLITSFTPEIVEEARKIFIKRTINVGVLGRCVNLYGQICNVKELGHKWTDLLF